MPFELSDYSIPFNELSSSDRVIKNVMFLALVGQNTFTDDASDTLDYQVTVNTYSDLE